jgi:hypothetical protein
MTRKGLGYVAGAVALALPPVGILWSPQRPWSEHDDIFYFLAMAAGVGLSVVAARLASRWFYVVTGVWCVLFVGIALLMNFADMAP